MAGMPVRRERRKIRDQQIREQAVRDYLGPNGANLFPNVVPISQDSGAPATINPSVLPSIPSIPSSSSALSPKLTEANELALNDAIETLKIRTDRLSPDFLKIKALKAKAAATVVVILARVDPGAMKGQRTDEVEAMLAELRQASKG